MESAGATVVPMAHTDAAVTGAECGGVLHPGGMSRSRPRNAVVRIERIIGSEQARERQGDVTELVKPKAPRSAPQVRDGARSVPGRVSMRLGRAGDGVTRRKDLERRVQLRVRNDVPGVDAPAAQAVVDRS